MKTSNLLYAVFFSILFMTLSACRAEEDTPIIDKENSYQLRFDLSILPLRTRATEMGIDDPLHENKITTMNAFIYDDAGTQQGHFSTTKGNLVINAAQNAIAGTATIYVPKTSGLSARYNGNEYHLYVIVNYHGTENLDGKSLTDLKSTVMTSESMVQSTIKPQDDFLMDGTMKTGVMNWATSNNYNITTITGNTLKLSRAAAKIRIRLEKSIEVKDSKDTYEVLGSPTIALKSYTKQTSLLAGSPIASPTYLYMENYQNMIESEYNGKKFYARQVPYYSYENDWTNNSQLRTYAVIKLRVRSQSTGKESDSYYSIPLNYLIAKDGMTAEEIAGTTKLQRNHLYDIECSIKELGSAEPTKPIDIPYGYITVEDWNQPDAIDVAITKAHYLVVKETKPEMLNIDTRYVEYVSDLDIDVDAMNSSIKFEYTQYNKDGSTRLITGTNKDGAIRVDTVFENNKKLLKITSPIPDNYVPLKIRFRVKQVQDEDGSNPLYKDVEVTQYPPVYVTAKQSSGNPIYWYSAFTSYNQDGPAGAGYQSNGTLFKITTLAPQDGKIVGDPTSNTDYTGRDEESNKIISPQFIVASQWGMSITVPQYDHYAAYNKTWRQHSYNLQYATGIIDRYRDYSGRSKRYYDYRNAEERAYNYWEDDYGISGTRTIQGDRTGNSYNTMSWTHTFKYEGHWRIPTIAELALIVKIQKDPNSAVKSLLWGHQYWSAQSGYAYNFDHGYAYQTTNNTAIRPVFDTYKINEQW
ncbi:MAG: hypothetical protein MR396_06045 [Phocaeicola sp.]|nr:hypothetical protein [Phocaeicola sp.]MDD7448837.1 hypothetical protein [Prevotellaceae bacterium]